MVKSQLHDASYLSGELESLVTFNLAHLEPATWTPVSAPLDTTYRILQLGAEVLQHVHLEVAGRSIPCIIIGHSSHVVGAPWEGLRDGVNMLENKQGWRNIRNSYAVMLYIFNIN